MHDLKALTTVAMGTTTAMTTRTLVTARLSDEGATTDGWRGADQRRAPEFVVQVAAAFEAVIHHDRLLPVELLPRGWPGAKARNLILDVDEACAPLLAGDGPVTLLRRYDDVLAQARRRRQR